MSNYLNDASQLIPDSSPLLTSSSQEDVEDTDTTHSLQDNLIEGFDLYSESINYDSSASYLADYSIFHNEDIDIDPDEAENHIDDVEHEGKITFEEKSLALSQELILRHDWPIQSLEIIAPILESHHCSGKTVAALNREIYLGITPSELELACQIKEYWSIEARYGAAISWKLAGKLAKKLGTPSSILEAQHLIEQIYEDWYNSENQRVCPWFSTYLRYRIGSDHMISGRYLDEQLKEFCQEQEEFEIPGTVGHKFLESNNMLVSFKPIAAYNKEVSGE